MAKKNNPSISKKLIRDMGKLIPRLPPNKATIKTLAGRVNTLELNKYIFQSRQAADSERSRKLEALVCGHAARLEKLESWKEKVNNVTAEGVNRVIKEKVALESQVYLSKIVALEEQLVTLRNEMLADMHRINGLEKRTVELATSNRDLALEVLRLDAFCRTVKTSALDVPLPVPKLVTVTLTQQEWGMVVWTFNKVYPGPEQSTTRNKIQEQMAKAMFNKGDTLNGAKA